MQTWIIAIPLAMALVIASIPRASAEPEKQALIILLGEACESGVELPYFVTCLNERHHLIAKQTVDPILFEYFHVVFVTNEKQSEHLGYSMFEESWGWCQNWKRCIDHEINHLREKTNCTSDAFHDSELVYVNGKYVTCEVARA